MDLKVISIERSQTQVSRLPDKDDSMAETVGGCFDVLKMQGWNGNS